MALRLLLCCLLTVQCQQPGVAYVVQLMPDMRAAVQLLWTQITCGTSDSNVCSAFGAAESDAQQLSSANAAGSGGKGAAVSCPSHAVLLRWGGLMSVLDLSRGAELVLSDEVRSRSQSWT